MRLVFYKKEQEFICTRWPPVLFIGFKCLNRHAELVAAETTSFADFTTPLFKNNLTTPCMAVVSRQTVTTFYRLQSSFVIFL
jgi:hypothetical protein